jgi:uncharacterized protein (TIGR03382 family)
MRSSSMILAAAGVLSLAGSASAQWVFLGNFGGHDYWHTPNTFFTFTEARAAAMSFGTNAYLVSINSASEQSFLNASIAPYTDGKVYWMGLEGGGTGLASFNTWDSGEAVTYTNWAGDAVLNSPTRRFGTFNWTPAGAWATLEDSGSPFGRKRAIVEVVPAPGAAALLGLAGLAVGRRRR